MEVIQARLRPNKDDDLRMAFNELPDYIDKADVIRIAMREYFFKTNETAINKKRKYVEIDYSDSQPIALNRKEITDEQLENNLDSFLSKV